MIRPGFSSGIRHNCVGDTTVDDVAAHGNYGGLGVITQTVCLSQLCFDWHAAAGTRPLSVASLEPFSRAFGVA